MLWLFIGMKRSLRQVSFSGHFFHTDLLPEKMPVDEAIFTGRITEEKFKHERLNQFKRLENQRQLDNYKVAPSSLLLVF